ncbi:hypothetical protein C3Y97_16050 [Bacillus sp. DU-106]|nr:hypothetical protein BW896_23810 [Bacillus cereus]PEE71427.1 hypothetical protein COM73_08930 [Bacillus thuringiensis]QCC41279.1 hypothetical protein C3Y97_16050 [Bacillus sp. DU-106]QCX95053.1 hypothetical protein EJ379_16270 [Bacillus cereus ATCC 14579]
MNIVFWVLILFPLLNIILLKRWNISPINLMGVFGNLKMLFIYSTFTNAKTAKILKQFRIKTCIF